MSQDAELAAYYEEHVLISLDRITLMCMVGACILALKHPDIPTSNKSMLKGAILQLLPFIDKHVPDNVLAEWRQALGVS